MFKTARYFFRDKVFIIATILAVLSMFIISPSTAYLTYINWRVLIIMFTLMIAVQGFYETHFFDFVATKLIMHFKSIRWIGFFIILATFFLAMFLTNDAVLLTLVPFTIFITRHTKQEKHVIIIIILQTFAANLGSALTPMGDPQNIYLYAFYDIPFFEFILTTLPIAIVGLILISITTMIKIPNTVCQLSIIAPTVLWKKLGLCSLILFNGLLCVLNILPEWYTLGITLFLALLYGNHLFKRVDYTLLLTFVSFFIFTGNLGQMNLINSQIIGLLDSKFSVYFTGLLTSQLISNVPAAVLLSTFTAKAYWQQLLLGVNVGSMGTIIASLASLITFKYMLKDYPSETKKYLITYTVLSLIFMVVISIVVLMLPLMF
ncbi:SLC13 family permease [Peloplasma aerotolerans]|uniref:SLC13 family permease n=1 Tax=Peloplasma aerotolerans TaxID=3044389 RepID=A0AAW6U6Z1_9MOLU|nr:SLC13 family permease [Mariniplasma sp. M4Ah]MDI6452277.1 SLC13 family permease [Mariniplasma sp. M4Ah]